jgi:hypothetical protein
MVDQLQRAIASRIATKQPIPEDTRADSDHVLVAKSRTETTLVYDTVLKQGHYSLWGRLATPTNHWGFFDLLLSLMVTRAVVACCRVVAASTDIDVVPDLPGSRSSFGEQVTSFCVCGVVAASNRHVVVPELLVATDRLTVLNE